MRDLTPDEIRRLQSLLNDIKKEYILGEIGRYKERYQDFLLNMPQRYRDTNIWSVSFSSQHDTFLHLIARNPHQNHWVNQKAIYQAVAGGADLNAVNVTGKTPLIVARERNNDDIVKLLLGAPKRLQWDYFISLCAQTSAWQNIKE
ncbi:MAG: hypothetical protein IJY58_06255 [Alphaproteobacteria bacterium]|nr:hypothetical protein [Alphaproteobacteria bacterium]